VKRAVMLTDIPYCMNNGIRTHSKDNGMKRGLC
jgi:hypothetical protein